MATKLRMMKFLQEARGYGLVTGRKPPARVSGLPVLASRAAPAREHLPVRRKLPITIGPHDAANTPRPVPITLISST